MYANPKYANPKYLRIALISTILARDGQVIALSVGHDFPLEMSYSSSPHVERPGNGARVELS